MPESKGKVVIGSQNEANTTLCVSLLQALGYETQPTTTLTGLEAALAQPRVNIVISELYLKDGASYTLRAQHSDLAWIGLANIISGDSVSFFLARDCGLFTVLDLPLSMAALVEAVSLVEQGLSSDAYRMHLWAYEWESLSIARNRFSPSQGLDTPDESDIDFADSNTPAPSFSDYRVPTMSIQLKPKKRSKLRWFNAPAIGNLRSTPFASVLWRFARDKATGCLIIRRRFLSASIYFKNGAILGFYASHPAFDFFNFMRRRSDAGAELVAQIEGLSKESGQSLSEIWMERESHKRSAKTMRREYMREQLLECFTWAEGSYHFQEGDGQVHDFPLGDAALREVFEQGIFEHTPLHRILRKTDELIPYVLKLNVEPAEARRYFTRSECFEMIDNLAFGDTLVEMLVHFPSHYPIHQTVYMLLILGLLELS